MHFVSALQEFAIEIPDAEADEIKTVHQGARNQRLPCLSSWLTVSVLVLESLSCAAIEYISKTPEGESFHVLLRRAFC